ncbi:Uncharacterised protein [Vibrio cholerae]|nr:Uncharacterised protein [Vibrio cholerae]
MLTFSHQNNLAEQFAVRVLGDADTALLAVHDVYARAT